MTHPTPSLVKVKENGEMWDTMFLIPRHLLDLFRWRSFAVAQVIDDWLIDS